MNEQRIKAFADHADRYAYSISDSDPSVNWYKIRDQKFAELIVLECCKFTQEKYTRDFDTVWRDDFVNQIKKHFGVK